MKKGPINVFILSFFILISVIADSCTPLIKSFDVNNRTITVDDTLIFNWEVRGKATLLYHEFTPADSEVLISIDSTIKILDYTLVVTKAGKEKSQSIQVTVLPKNSRDEIIFQSTLSNNGDTVIAIGEKNPTRWGHLFEILTVAVDSGVSLSVKHEGRSFDLDSSGALSDAFKGTSVAGHWEFRHVLNSSEKSNPPLSLEFLHISTIIQYKKK